MGSRLRDGVMLRIDLRCECSAFSSARVSASLRVVRVTVGCRYDDSVLANVRRLQAAYGAPVARKGKAKMK